MFYVFHGEDTHSQKVQLDKLTSGKEDAGMLELNTTKFDKLPTLSELQNAANAMPFLAKVRLVIVSGLLSHNDKTQNKALAEWLPTLPETTRLFFLESSPLKASHPVVKVAQSAENGYIKLFEKLEGSKLERWIRERVEAQNGRISPHAIHLLATNVGSDLQILQNEIDKLVLYKQTDTIESNDVLLLSPYAAETNIFNLVDAIGNRNGKKSALLLQQMVAEGADPFYLFAMFVRQFRLLLQVKELADEGERPPAIAKSLRMHSFVAGKLYQQSQGFSLSQLESIYRHLLTIDVGVKTGQQEMSTSLDLLIANLTLA